MTRTRSFDVAAMALAIAISVGVAGVSCSAGTATPVAARSDLANQQEPNAQTRPLALFIGDSYTEGGGSAEMSYGCRAVVQMDLLCAVSATGGTGYISGGAANRWVDQYVGKSLSISERTVGSHVEHVMTKLGIRSRTRVAVWAVEHGLGGSPNHR